MCIFIVSVFYFIVFYFFLIPKFNLGKRSVIYGNAVADKSMDNNIAYCETFVKIYFTTYIKCILYFMGIYNSDPKTLPNLVKIRGTYVFFFALYPYALFAYYLYIGKIEIILANFYQTIRDHIYKFLNW